ncbi:MAG: hypothetical protein JOZ90_10555 [Alphaproteobacteria bacterium]|nr:hypothetical protein [Alphaproteobacteria bacterium]MBV9371101.1 hypothetical protein [Alphaproteobacteria bacterium]MBV9901525.1 hypothetical protein [Alphaproteobacteria bacterium]
MRILLIASLVILPLLIFYALRAVTGDPLSAIIFGLMIFVTVAAWLGGRPAASGALKRW